MMLPELAEGDEVAASLYAVPYGFEADLDSLLHEAHSVLVDADTEEAASHLIQAYMRGYLCRAALQDQVKAATAVQTNVRGLLVRAALFDEFASQYLDRASDPRFHALHVWQLNISYDAHVRMLHWRGLGAWRPPCWVAHFSAFDAVRL